jgi:hypothetical protein
LRYDELNVLFQVFISGMNGHHGRAPTCGLTECSLPFQKGSGGTLSRWVPTGSWDRRSTKPADLYRFAVDAVGEKRPNLYCAGRRRRLRQPRPPSRFVQIDQAKRLLYYSFEGIGDIIRQDRIVRVATRTNAFTRGHFEKMPDRAKVRSLITASAETQLKGGKTEKEEKP